MDGVRQGAQIGIGAAAQAVETVVDAPARFGTDGAHVVGQFDFHPLEGGIHFVKACEAVVRRLGIRGRRLGHGLVVTQEYAKEQIGGRLRVKTARNTSHYERAAGAVPKCCGGRTSQQRVSQGRRSELRRAGAAARARSLRLFVRRRAASSRAFSRTRPPSSRHRRRPSTRGHNVGERQASQSAGLRPTHGAQTLDGARRRLLGGALLVIRQRILIATSAA